MRKLILIIAILGIISGSVFSQDPLKDESKIIEDDSSAVMFAPTLQAAFYTVPFYSTEEGPYLETYISVFGKSLGYFKNENLKLQASVGITILFKQEDKVVEFRKYNLLSPEIDMSKKARPGENALRNLGVYLDILEENDKGLGVVLPNFMDIQRIPLPVGLYDLELIIKDNSSDSTDFIYNKKIDIQYSKSKIEISGIQLVEKYSPTVNVNVLSKSGYDIVPYISDYYPKNINEIIFYTEIYNSDKILPAGDSYLVKTYIEVFETSKALHSYNKFIKQKAEPVNILLNKFDIEELPSGNYNLVVEARDRENNLMNIRKLFFQRNKPNAHYIMDDIASINIENTFISGQNSLDTLSEYLRCLYPIADISERRYIENLLKRNETDLMKQFFYNFWSSKNGLDPANEWRIYKGKVRMVNLSYTTQIKKGYETDRGRVYLQYGEPNTIRERKHEPHNYPFEIWHYYSLNGISDQKFLFYNPALVGDEYELLHSNVIGEIITVNWLASLNIRSLDPQNLLKDPRSETDIQIDSDYGNIAKEIWDNP